MMARPASNQHPVPTGRFTDEDVCNYIAEMCTDLRHMSRRPNLRMINYLLDIVRLEAEKTAKEFREDR